MALYDDLSVYEDVLYILMYVSILLPPVLDALVSCHNVARVVCCSVLCASCLGAGQIRNSIFINNLAMLPLDRLLCTSIDICS